MDKLTNLSNIGKVLENNLNHIGIKSIEELSLQDSKDIFRKILLHEPDACISKLFAIEGAKQNVRWHNLSDDAKNDLKSFYNTL